MTEQTSKDAILVHAVGNVAPRRVEYGEPVESLFGMVHQRIKEGDISFCHFERICSTRGCLQYRDHNTWDSRIDPENARSLAFAGFNVASHAGNRCFDYGPEALLDSMYALRQNGIQVIGAGKNITEARKPAIVERKGVRVGFLAYNSVLPVEYEAREGKPGCAPIRVATYYEAQGYQPGTPPKIVTVPAEQDVRAMEEDIRKLRNLADAVIVSIHWGQDYVPDVLATYQSPLGHRVIDAGADLVLGHHGRRMRGIETYKGKAIFHTLGSFAEERAPRSKPPPGGSTAESIPDAFHKLKTESGWERNPYPQVKRYAMMVKCTVSQKGIRKLAFLPSSSNQRAEPEFLSRNDPKFEEVLQYMGSWCQGLGTTLTVDGDEVVVYNEDDEIRMTRDCHPEPEP
ncbi:MAG: CapA family protein [Chloroflexi bacterium]|nr:CapA family protein [Chloroflexota bacterium]